jgi:hypothetical protein
MVSLAKPRSPVSGTPVHRSHRPGQCDARRPARGRQPITTAATVTCRRVRPSLAPPVTPPSGPTATGLGNYTYDAAGRTLTGPGRTYGWDGDGQLVSAHED